ncbi:MAG TPA: LysR family transcriptional regulator [Thermoanaerobaculia bacterium]|nr:LysR family transcriptional regulator [Thermoanaerobaculia bacterium]
MPGRRRYTGRPMNGIELRHLRYFLAVAEELSFSRAAERLGMAQPPLSQQIQRLETLVGHELFERRPRVRLTPAGEAFLAAARRALAQVEEGVEASHRAARGEVGTVTVGFAASMILSVVPGAVRAFRRRFPGVDLQLRELSSAAQLAALREGRIDVAFVRESPFSDRELGCERLREEPFVHFPRPVAPGLYDLILALCQGAGFKPRVVQEAQEWLTIVGLVEAGMGVSLVPESFRKLRWGKVVYLPLDRATARSTILLCWRATGERTAEHPAVQAFLQTAREAWGREGVQ